MFNIRDLERNEYMLRGPLAKKGYDWWWHSFTATNEKTGERVPFFLEFFVCNPMLAEEKPVFGQLEDNKKRKKKPSYVMIKVGCHGKNKKQLHRFFAHGDVDIMKYAPFNITADDCYLSDVRTNGCVEVTKEDSIKHKEYMSDYGKIEWKLDIIKDIPFNVGYGAGRTFRKMNAFEMYWHAEGMKTMYEGYVEMDGERYTVSRNDSYGYADKNWGSDFTSPWIWLSSNNMVSNITRKRLKNSVFDIGGGCPKAFGISLKRRILGALYYEGEEFEFNFSKFWMGVKNKFECVENDKEVIWRVVMENKKSIVKLQVHCNKEEMLFMNYEDPCGNKKHNRLWNGGNGKGRLRIYKKIKNGKELIDDISIFNVGCEYGEFDK